MPTTTVLPPDRFFDLVIIGAGPASLSLVARILEERPAALYTEDEHRHLHWLRTSHRRSLIQTKRPGNGSDRYISGVKQIKASEQDVCACEGMMKILVVDRVGSWMGLWNRLFKAFDIPYLRSPLFFHPAPYDLDALLAYAIRSPNRSSSRTRKCQPDLIEIPGCVGKELSKHKKKKNRASAAGAAAAAMGPAVNERDRKDYYAASTEMFRAFVRNDIVERYGLQGSFESLETAFEPSVDRKEGDGDGNGEAVKMIKTQVRRLEWGELQVEGWEKFSGFCLQLGDSDAELDRKVHVGAKAVVCASGAGASPSIPPYLVNAPSPKPFGNGWAHTSALGLPHFNFPPPALLQHERRGQRTSLVVIGGGLTSAQMCDLALKRGISKVTLVLRGHLKVKPFDVGLEWMGRYSNLQKMRFWQEDDPQVRLRMIREARNGGSITPHYVKILKAYEEQGRLEILTCTKIDRADFFPSDGPSPKEEEEGSWRLNLTTNHSKKQQQRQKQEQQQAKESQLTTSPVVPEENSGSLPSSLSSATARGDADDKSSSSSHSSKKSKKKSTRHGSTPVPHVTPPPPVFSSEELVADEGDASLSMSTTTTSTIETSYVVAATGSTPSFASLPFLQPFLQQQASYTEIGGLPLLDEGLQLESSEIDGEAAYPLFFVGGYSALQVGPGAFNLEGMRAAADRVAIRLAELASSDPSVTATATTETKGAQDTVNSSKVDHAMMYLPTKQARPRSQKKPASSDDREENSGENDGASRQCRRPDGLASRSAFSHFSFEMLEVGVES